MQGNKDKIKILNKIIGETIKEHRKISINKFAKNSELDPSNISKIERGIYSSKVASIWLIAEALGMRISELFKFVEENLPEDFSLFDD